MFIFFFFFFQAEDGILDLYVTGVQTCALPISPGAAAESGIIHSPDFNCAIVPCLDLSSGPMLSAIGIAIKTQNIKVCTTLLLRSTRLRNPNFQFSVVERNDFANGPTRIDRRPGWK